MSTNLFCRSCGIFMPIFSLPTPYGIGTLGKEAYDFVNIPQKAKEAVANTVEQNLRFFAEGWKSELK